VTVRILDIVISLIGLLLLAVGYPFIALLIKFDSKGPVFYRGDRVGRGGKLFRMYKFRTMYETPEQMGPSLSCLGDPRVTPVGRVLRRLKLNEVPQCLNILKGDMTLIGPRPEAPDLAAAYPEEARIIFSVKPGLAGPNQILGRNEEEVYPPGVDPVRFYIEDILPKKLPLDLEYINNKSYFKYLKYLFLAVKVTVTQAIGRRHLIENRSQLALLVVDMVSCLIAFSLAHYIRFEGTSDPLAQQAFFKLLPLAALIRLPVFLYFGFYHLIIRYLSLYDIKRVIQGAAVSSLVFLGVSFLSGLTYLPGLESRSYSRSVFIIDFSLLTTLLIGYRVLLKKWDLHQRPRNNSDNQKRRVIIWGAGDGGDLCLRYLQNQQGNGFQVLGFIDDARKSGANGSAASKSWEIITTCP
jgi:lipopolysaccharide/colanic/teichoic acid biosynthesis glycosyltransferase